MAVIARGIRTNVIQVIQVNFVSIRSYLAVMYCDSDDCGCDLMTSPSFEIPAFAVTVSICNGTNKVSIPSYPKEVLHVGIQNRMNSMRYCSLRLTVVAKPYTGFSFRSGGVHGWDYRQLWTTQNSRTHSTSIALPNLYQYAICPYCNISKALLLYTRTPYNAVEVNPLTKGELKSLPDKTYKKVPVLWNPSDQDSQKNGSEEIVQFILTLHPTIDKSSDSAIKWTAFARDDLAPLLYPNLCNTLSKSYDAFGYVHSTPSFSLTQRYSIQIFGSIAMHFAASKIKQKRNITDELAALKEALDSFNAALCGTSFLSEADQPHLGDLTIYGILRGLRGLEVMNVLEDYPKIKAWLERMQLVVEPQDFQPAK